MAIDCNEIHTVAAELKERFTPCYKLKASDMDELVELIQAVEECVSTGTGFMTKSIYDTNDSGDVDNAELVNSLTVETAVPPGAVFTDTVPDLSTKEDYLGNPLVNGQLLSSTTGGVRTWVNTAPGAGDMSTAIYDTNNSDIVDNAELVNGLTVQTAVPVAAVFTDTVYDDTAVYAAIALKESDLGNPAANGYILSSTIGGTRSWIEANVSGTDLAYTASPTQGVVTSTTGADATLPLASVTNAGLLDPADKVLLNNTSGVNTGDVDTDLAYVASPTGGTVLSSTGTDASLILANNTNAGLMAPAEKTLLGNQSGINTGDQDMIPYDQHISNVSNPHLVDKTDVNLANVDDTSDANKPVSTPQQTALDLKQDVFMTDFIVNTSYSTLDANSAQTAIVQTGGTVTLDSATVSTGFMLQIYNDKITDTTILVEAGDTIKNNNPVLGSGYFAYVLYLGANDWVVSVGGEPTIDPIAIRVISGTTDTLVITDIDKYLRCTNAAATAVTVPPNSSVEFLVGTQISIRQAGTGTVTVTEGAGVTINTDETLVLAGQHATATLIKVATDEWDIMGGLTLA